MGFEIVQVANVMAVVLGVMCGLVSFLMPKGPFGAPGLILVAMGAALGVASVATNADGYTYAQAALVMMLY